MNLPTLIPIGDAPTTGVLLALDFDGVLNRFNDAAGPVRKSVRTAHGRSYMIDFDPAVITALDDVVRDHNIVIGWLTTWGPNARAFIEQAFDGKLSGGHVLKKMPARHRGHVPANWKYTGLRDRVQVTGQKFVWVDDEAIDMSVDEPGFDEFTAGGLLLRTDPVTGITFAQIELIRAYAAE